MVYSQLCVFYTLIIWLIIDERIFEICSLNPLFYPFANTQILPLYNISVCIRSFPCSHVLQKIVIMKTAAWSIFIESTCRTCVVWRSSTVELPFRVECKYKLNKIMKYNHFCIYVLRTLVVYTYFPKALWAWSCSYREQKECHSNAIK